jgi:hypothetical protein
MGKSPGTDDILRDVMMLLLLESLAKLERPDEKARVNVFFDDKTPRTRTMRM